MLNGPSALAADENQIPAAVGSTTYFDATRANGALRLSTGNLILWGAKTADDNGQAGWIMEVNTNSQEVYSLTLKHDNDDSTISVIGASESSQGVLLLTKDSQTMNSCFFSLDTAGYIISKVPLRKGVDILSTSTAEGGLLVAGDTFQNGKTATTPWVTLLDAYGNIAWEHSGDPSDEVNPTASSFYSLCTSLEDGAACIQNSVQGNPDISQMLIATFSSQGSLLCANKLETQSEAGYYSGAISAQLGTLLFGCVNGDVGKIAKALCAYPDGRIAWESEYNQFGILTSAIATSDGYLIAASSYRNGAFSTDLLFVDSRGDLVQTANICKNIDCEIKSILCDGENNYWLIGNVFGRAFILELRL
jgi:hypothetical protein